MISARILTTCLALLAPARAKARPLPAVVDAAALLRAIAARESRSNPHAIGHHGERSQYQITRDTWRLHSQAAFAWASNDPELANQIAERHLGYLASVLRLQRQPQDAAHLAAAWHYGPKFAHLCLNTEYVAEVLNLYRLEVEK